MKETGFIGKKVRHKVYGYGHVISFDKTYVMVRFENQDEEKLFSYPKSFEKFISFEDRDLQDRAKEEIDNNRNMKKITQEEIVKQGSRITLDTVQLGDSFKTHAEVLNDCFGYNYEIYQPAYKKIDGGKYAVWFPNIAILRDGKYVSTDKTSGWVNILKNKGQTLIQMDKDNKQTPDALERLVFAKQENSDRYMFIGVFGTGKHVEGGVEYSLISESFSLKNMSPIIG